jgi:polyisoprenoid-binding protein YceI
MKRLALSVALASLVGSVFAAPETYTIDASHSAPRFEYNHLGFSTQSHSFDKISGKIVLDREAKTGSADIVIDTKSINTGDSEFYKHLQDEDFFDTAKFPTITFKSTSVKFDGDKPVELIGDLTIKGVTKPVTLTVTAYQNKVHPMRKKDAIGANAVAKIKRSDFNISKFVPYVSDEVSLTLPVEAFKE